MNPARTVTVRDIRHIPVLACVLLVTLRLFIGWQFLYEGLWKLDSQSTAQPWTAAGFLKNAQGPFRDLYRGMTGDPDDLAWLDPAGMSAKWDHWAARFAQHYGLDDRQRGRLAELLGGPSAYAAKLDKLPPGLQIPADLKDTVRYDTQRKLLLVDGERHLLPAEKVRLLSLVKLPADPAADPAAFEAGAAFMKAVEDVYARNARLDFKERLAVTLGASDPDRARIVFSNFKGTLGDAAPERVDTYYRQMLADYEVRRKHISDLEFEQDHLARSWREIQELRAGLVNPVRALEADLKAQSLELLTDAQRTRGPLPEPWTDQKRSDWMTIIALIGLGLLLIAGLGTRAAAVLGAGMLLSFYLVWPPFPSVIADPGPEHAYIVNKNLIEVVALLSLAAMPTGQWFGLDGLIYRGWRWWQVRRLGTSRPERRKTPVKPTFAGVK